MRKVPPAQTPFDWLMVVIVSLLTGGVGVRGVSAFGHLLEQRAVSKAKQDETEDQTRARITLNDRDELMKFIVEQRSQKVLDNQRIAQLEAGQSSLQQELYNVKLERERERAAWQLERYRMQNEINELKVRLSKYEALTTQTATQPDASSAPSVAVAIATNPEQK